MSAQFFPAMEQIPWALVIPVTAGVAVTGMALVMSRFLLGGGRRSPPSAEAGDGTPPKYDPFVQGSASEQRGTLRRGGNPVEVVLTEKGHEGPEIRGWVIDRSMGGLCLTVDDAVPVGAVLTVRAVKAPPATPGIDIEVKSCRRTKEEWELGCQFVKTPPWAIMLLFG